LERERAKAVVHTTAPIRRRAERAATPAPDHDRSAAVRTVQRQFGSLGLNKVLDKAKTALAGPLGGTHRMPPLPQVPVPAPAPARPRVLGGTHRLPALPQLPAVGTPPPFQVPFEAREFEPREDLGGGPAPFEPREDLGGGPAPDAVHAAPAAAAPAAPAAKLEDPPGAPGSPAAAAIAALPSQDRASAKGFAVSLTQAPSPDAFDPTSMNQMPAQVVDAAVEMNRWGLRPAEVTAIRTFTQKDYEYINPAVAGDDSWMWGQTEKGASPDPKVSSKEERAQGREERRGFHEEGRLHGGIVMQALGKLPAKSGTTYRGARVNRTGFSTRYVPRGGQALATFMSTSSDITQAEKFATTRAARTRTWLRPSA
jgi:hypothetical protein